MIKSKLQTIALVLLAAVAFSAPLSLKAQTAAASPAASATPKAKKPKATPPVTGAVTAVDKTAKTFTIAEKVYTTNDATKWATGVTLDTLAVGTKVTVNYTKDGDTLTATAVKVAKAKKAAN